MLPDHYTADRLDRVVVGQLVHTDRLRGLADPAPESGWLEVSGLSNDGAVVTLTLADESLFTDVVNRIVRIGW